jgi:NRAMP (natural resistance-associated macrophage protein)-like metal ion transporter
MKETTNQQPGKRKRLFSKLGPGIITGASDDDPSGIATYSAAGAGFGLNTLWTAFLTIPLMAAIQEMCARIGIVTRQGLAATLKQHYPRPVLNLVLLLSLPAITLNIGANLQGMGAVMHMLFPVIPGFGYSIFFAAVLLLMIIRFPYRKIATILKWLCLSLLLYVFVPAAIHLDWGEVIKKAFMPSVTLSPEYISILVAILGTTISPYLFFWQANMEAEEMEDNGSTVIVDKKILSEMEVDVNMGMIFSNLVMFFIILTAGSVLYTSGIFKIETVAQAAEALRPLVGEMAHFFFALGVLGTGLLSIPVLAGAQSYLLSETAGWSGGLNKKFHQAPAFYSTMIVSLLVGLSLDFLGISPIKALLYTAILYGITAPVMIGIILHIANNSKIMGEFTNSVLSNLLGRITLLLMTLSAAALLYFSIVD